MTLESIESAIYEWELRYCSPTGMLRAAISMEQRAGLKNILVEHAQKEPHNMPGAERCPRCGQPINSISAPKLEQCYHGNPKETCPQCESVREDIRSGYVNEEG